MPAARHRAPDRVVKFGFYASGRPWPDSNVDLLVVTYFPVAIRTMSIVDRPGDQLVRPLALPEAALSPAELFLPG